MGQITTQVVEPVALESDRLYRNLGVKWYAEGTFQRDPKPGSAIKATKLFRVRPGQFVYNRLFATEGSFAVVRDEDIEAVASNEFPVFDVDRERLLPEFLYLHFQQPNVWEEVNRQCTGTTKSRLRWKEDRFREYQLLVPPRPEQERIVDLIGAVDDVIDAAAAALSRVDAGRLFALQALFSNGQSRSMRDLLDRIEGGRSPKGSDVPPRDDQFGVLKVSAVTRLGFIPSESKTVDDVGVFAHHHRVAEGDALITRANTAALVGQACLVEEPQYNLFLCDKTLRLVPAESVPSGAIVAALNSPQARDQLSSAATGTSASMKNISQTDIMNVRIQWPSDPHIAAAMDKQLLRVIREHKDQINRLRTLRANLMTALLSGEHEIPESYDELMGAAS